MKTKIIKYGFLSLFVSLGMSCSQSDTPPLSGTEYTIYTYPLQLEGGIPGYEENSRASEVWQDGAQVYLQFDYCGTMTSGVAVYRSADADWVFSTETALSVDSDGECTAAYFEDVGNISGNTVSTTPQTAVFHDSEGEYVFADNKMYVRLYLIPTCGRVRFKGAPSATFSLSGLTYTKSYDTRTGRFTQSEQKISGVLDNLGVSGYYYACFSDIDTRKLLMDGPGNTSWERSFAPEVLAVGESGYITLPGTDLPGAWVLMNTANNKEIHTPTVSEVVVTRMRSRYASCSATVIDAGNGCISHTGFVYSAQPEPSVVNGKVISCGVTINITTRLSGLEPSKLYYIRAYARNEYGTCYGPVASFRTLSQDEDKSEIDKGEFAPDECLGENINGEGIVNKGEGE